MAYGLNYVKLPKAYFVSGPKGETMSQGHYADDSMTPKPIGVSKDDYGNELASDRSYHGEATPGKGSLNFDGGHYSDDWCGGFETYGKSVGKPAEGSRTSVDVSKANRGKDS